MNLGIVQAHLNNLYASEESYKKALSYRRIYPDCHFNLGTLYLKMNQLSLAEEAFKKVNVDYAPKNLLETKISSSAHFMFFFRCNFFFEFSEKIRNYDGLISCCKINIYFFKSQLNKIQVISQLIQI